MTAPAYAKSGIIYKNNAYAIVVALQRFDVVTGEWTPLTGLLNVTAELDHTTGQQTPLVGPFAMLETAIAGTYAYTMTTASVNTATSNHNTLYQTVKVGTDAVLTTPLVVQDFRYTP